VIKISRFAELGTNKDSIMMNLITDDNIVKALYFKERDFLSQSIPVGFNRKRLIYSNIYPYRFVPKITQDQSTFITMSFNFKPCGVTFKYGFIYFYIITHESLVRTDIGMLRYDYIINQIDELFNRSRDITIGQLEFNDMDEFILHDGNWVGAYIKYKAVDFQ
jgi:hypothetical protein